MNESGLDILVKRVARLERQNSRYKRVGIVAFLAISTVTLMGQIPVNQEVRAQKFRPLRCNREKQSHAFYS